MNRISIKVMGIEVRGEKAINFINERLVKDLAETDSVVKVLEVINEEGFAMFEVETNFHNPVTVADYFISFINRRKRFIITRNEEVVVEEVAVAEEEGEVKAEISADELNRKYGNIAEKCKRAVEIIQEDYAVGMSQEDVQDIYNKGAELYGKAFTDAVPQEILDYIQGGTIIYKGVNGNLEELRVDLNDLEQLQELVGGNIQTVELPCNIIMVVNESGWVDNLPMNFRLNNLTIFGDVFFCSYNDADFVGLSTKQKRFIKEEIFKQIGVRLT